jgi:hypothetical protein
VCESSDFDFYAGGGDGFGGGRYGDKFVFSERVFVFNVRDECSSVFLFSIFTFFFFFFYSKKQKQKSNGPSPGTCPGWPGSSFAYE